MTSVVVNPGSVRRRGLQRADEQARGDDEHQRQRDLGDDERVAEPEPPAIGGGRGAVEQRRQVVAERVAGRRQAEGERRGERDARARRRPRGR